MRLTLADMDQSRDAQQAQTSLDIQSTKLEKVLENTTKHFIADLLPWCFDPESPQQGLKAVLKLLDNGEEGLWSIRARFGWWREFVRLVSSAQSIERVLEYLDRRRIWAMNGG